jgi:hypothetical protein
VGASLINRVLGAAAIVLAVAGCTDSRAGTPVSDGTTTIADPTGSTAPSSTPGSTERYGAPPVATSLNATKFLSQPCAALTSPQLQILNLPAQGKSDTDSAVARNAGPSCKWSNIDTSTGIDVQFVTGNKNGLADVYRTHEEGKWKAYWEETSVAGYPGVFADVTDLRPRGSCNLFVGISDTLAFGIGTTGRLKEQSCDLAKQVAAAVVETLKRGG